MTAIKDAFHDKMYSIMDIDFAEWLNKQLQVRNWSQSELANKAGIHRQVISSYIGGQRQKPDAEILLTIARALKLPPEEVLRAAKLLPQVSETTEKHTNLVHLFDLLPPEEQERVLRYVRLQVDIQEEQKR